MEQPFEYPLRAGLVQLTGMDLLPGQHIFPERTPADPVVYQDERSGEIFVYGTQVSGRGITYLRYPDLATMLAGGPYERVCRAVRLPTGGDLAGKEAIWDTYRLSFRHLEAAFPEIEAFYVQHGMKPGSDLYYGGVALKRDGSLGAFPEDNWRRRIHAMVERVDGSLELIREPVFNPIDPKAKTSDYVGFGELPGLPGDYLGHAYGPNFKLISPAQSASGRTELWLIHEEVCRRTAIAGRLVELTEIFARRMLTPLRAEQHSVRLLSVEDADGRLAPDACRGPLLNYTKLLEGFRPMQVEPEGIRIKRRARRQADGSISYQEDSQALQKEYFFLTGSSGNFSGDDYDVLLAVREGTAISPYAMLRYHGSARWKRLLSRVKKARGLSWAGRGCFVRNAAGQWWILFHAVDKALRPQGSYTGEIPPDTEAYHRNLYLVPIEFVINLDGEADVLVLDASPSAVQN